MTRFRPYRDSDYPARKALVRKLFPGGEPPPPRVFRGAAGSKCKQKRNQQRVVSRQEGDLALL